MNCRYQKKNEALISLLSRVLQKGGWYGTGPNRGYTYCGYCGAQHRELNSIPHHKSCPILEVIEVLS